MKAKVRLADNFPTGVANGAGCSISGTVTYQGTGFVENTNFIRTSTSGQPTTSRGWIDVMASVKVLIDFEPNPSYHDVALRILVADTSAPAGDYYFYVDAVEYYVVPGELYTGKPYDAGDSASEIKLTDALLAGNAWTVTGLWCPMTADKCLLVNTYDLNIISVGSISGGYIDLRWDNSDQKFTLYDGSTNISHASNTYTPFFQDLVAFAIIGDSTGSLCYIHDPLNGLYVIGSGESAPLLRKPSIVRLGSDNANNVDIGSFANIRVFNEKLSESEVETVFDSVSRMKRSSGSSSGGLFGGSGIFGN
jgi:hypothetical protein